MAHILHVQVDGGIANGARPPSLLSFHQGVQFSSKLHTRGGIGLATYPPVVS